MKRVRFVTLLSFVALLVLPPGQAAAHPLGNFTINAFSDIQVSPTAVVIDYAVDMAEVPTFQLKSDMELPDSGTTREVAVADALGDELVDNVSLTTAGAQVRLQLDGVSADFRPGQGGLEVLRVDARFSGTIVSAETSLSYEDRNFEDRIGWREIILRGIEGQGVVDSSVPATSTSGGLRNYPKDLLLSPPSVTEATATVRPGADSSPEAEAGVPAGPQSDIFGASFASLIESDPSAGVMAGALLLALVFGAVHALGPGHGKTVMAAYLVGAEGRARQAVIVGVAVSLMHTTSVVVLGLVTLWASKVLAPETVYPWLSLVSGLVVLGLGSWLLSVRLRANRRARAAASALAHGPDHELDHSHSHENHHDHDPGTHEHGAHHNQERGRAAAHARAHAAGVGHSHGDLPAGVPLLSTRGLGAIAVSGGLLPSPSALVVLLGAVALNRVVFGIALVAAFSVGLAAALTIIGLLVLKARDVARRRVGGRAGRILPVLSAAAIVVIGLFLTTQAVARLPL